MKYSQGIYVPQNPSKYAGKGSIRYRSSWEHTFMQFCDTNPNIISWASEAIQIPYYNPIKQKKTHYIPDFFIKYQNAAGQIVSELIEIKPSKETSLEAAGRSVRNQYFAVINQAKWQAADNWCKSNNINFRIVTENDMFAGSTKKR